jgi:hypothetical protein
MVVGHADLDAARESREPGFLQFISEKRAIAVANRLCCRLADKLRPDPERLRAISWLIVGRGARTLAVSSPRTEAERKCNRRVEITLKRSDPLPPRPFPKLNYDESLAAAADEGTATDCYHVALQGTSGQYDRPEVAEKKAREIAEKIPSFIEKRKRDRMLKRLYCPEYKIPGSIDKFDVTGCWDPADELQFFKDASRYRVQI